MLFVAARMFVVCVAMVASYMIGRYHGKRVGRRSSDVQVRRSVSVLAPAYAGPERRKKKGKT